MYSEGALKRLKFAEPMRRMRVYPWANPQPVSTPVLGPSSQCGTCAVFFGQSSLASDASLTS